MATWSKKQRLLLLLFLGVIFLYSFNQLKESDSFYHLKTGQLIWEAKAVPTTDPFSYTANGSKWITHEWLAELIFYGAWKAGGFWLLMAFIALLGAITYYLLFRFALSKGANFYLSLVLLFAVGGLTFELWVPRPQVFSYLLFVSVIFLLEKFRHVGRPKYLIALVLLIWAWANLHASVFLGLILILVYLGAEIFAFILPRVSSSGFSFRRFKWFSAALLAGAGISMLNPNGKEVLTYLLTIKSAIQSLGITEWKPIWAYIYETETKVFLAEMILGTGLIFWWYGIRKASREIAPVILALMVFLMPFVSIRHVGFWPLAVFPFLMPALSYFFKKASVKISEKNIFRAVLIFAVLFLAARYITFPRSYFNSDTVPVYATDFVLANNLKGPLFNLYNDGGYLIWKLYPGEKVAIDGRSEVYGQKELNDILGITWGAKNWDELVNKKYKINYFFLGYRPSDLAKNISPLIVNLYKEGWPLIYWDDTTTIFARAMPENVGLINKYGLRHISPFRNPDDIPKEEAPAVAVEISRLMDISKSNSVLREWTSRFLAGQGQK